MTQTRSDGMATLRYRFNTRRGVRLVRVITPGLRPGVARVSVR